MRFDQVDEAYRLVTQVAELENAHIALCKLDNVELSVRVCPMGTNPAITATYITATVNEMAAFVHTRREALLARLLELGVDA